MRLGRLGRARLSVDGVGLISLQVAEKKRKRAQNTAVGGEALDTPPRASPVIRPSAGCGQPANRTSSGGLGSSIRKPWHPVLRQGSLAPPGRERSRAWAADLGAGQVRAAICRSVRDQLSGGAEKNRIATIVDEIIAKARTIDQTPMAGTSEHDRQLIDRTPRAKNLRNEPTRNRLLEPERTDATLPVASKIPTNEAVSPVVSELVTNEAVPPGAVEPPSIEVSSVEVPSDEATSEPPKPDQEPKHTPSTSTDDDLIELIRKFAPDSNFLRKG